MSNWQDPNIEVLTTSPSYDSTKPMKRWVDKRTYDDSNKAPFFTYNKLVQGKVEQFTLSRVEAGGANIPPFGVADTSNTSTWNRLEVPIPIRDLKFGESITTDPFGQIIITKESDRAVRLSDLAVVVEKLDKILDRVK